MSDTPRTDAITTHWNLSLENMNRRGRMLLDLSRQLERELAVMTERFKMMDKNSADNYDCAKKLEETLAAQRTALQWCYEKLQPLVPFDDWIKEIGK